MKMWTSVGTIIPQIHDPHDISQNPRWYPGFPGGQLVKNLPAMWEAWVCFLGWEDPLEKGKAIPSPVFWSGELHGLLVHGVVKSQTGLNHFRFHWMVPSKHLVNIVH